MYIVYIPFSYLYVSLICLLFVCYVYLSYFLLYSIKHRRTYTPTTGVFFPFKTSEVYEDVERPISKPNPGTSISSTQRLRVPTAGDSWFFVANSTATGSWKAQPQIQTFCQSHEGKMMRKFMKKIGHVWKNMSKIHGNLQVVEVLETQLFVVFSS